MKVKSESEVAQSCQTLRDPMDHSLPGSSIHGILQARVLEWGAIAFSDHLSPPQSQVTLRWKWQWAQGSAEKSQCKREDISVLFLEIVMLALLPEFPSCLPISDNVDAPTILNSET